MTNTLNPLTDTPTAKTQITKKFMLAYLKSSKATAADRKWFKSLCNNSDYQTTIKSNLPGVEAKTDIDIKKVRTEFCKRFFPNLNEKKVTKNKSFLDMVDDL